MLHPRQISTLRYIYLYITIEIFSSDRVTRTHLHTCEFVMVPRRTILSSPSMLAISRQSSQAVICGYVYVVLIWRLRLGHRDHWHRLPNSEPFFDNPLRNAG